MYKRSLHVDLNYKPDQSQCTWKTPERERWKEVVTRPLPKYNSSPIATNVIVGSKLYMSQLRGHMRNRNINLKHNHQLVTNYMAHCGF